MSRKSDCHDKGFCHNHCHEKGFCHFLGHGLTD